MDEGLIYVVAAFVLIWAVLGGYLLYMVRRARSARDALAARIVAPALEHTDGG